MKKNMEVRQCNRKFTKTLIIDVYNISEKVMINLILIKINKPNFYLLNCKLYDKVKFVKLVSNKKIELVETFVYNVVLMIL